MKDKGLFGGIENLEMAKQAKYFFPKIGFCYQAINVPLLLRPVC